MPNSLMTPRIRTQPVKKALSIAIRYSHLADAGWQLDHAHDDSDHVINLLTTTFGYLEENIVVLKDCDDPQQCSPTRENILQAMGDLVSNGMPGDHLVCHISGHGSQVLCPVQGQEKDGWDEVFWPMDIQFHPEGIKNFIRDDDIKNILVDGLRPGASLVLIVDCCHSGTMADLPHSHSDHLPRTRGLRIQQTDYRFESDTANELNSAITEPDEAETMKRLFPNVVCWSACRDEQVTYSPGNSAGLFIQLLTTAIRDDTQQTHGQLLHKVTEQMVDLIGQYNDVLVTRGGSFAPVSPPKPHISSLSYLTEIFETPVYKPFGRHSSIMNSELLAGFSNLLISPSSTDSAESD